MTAILALVDIQNPLIFLLSYQEDNERRRTIVATSSLTPCGTTARLNEL